MHKLPSFGPRPASGFTLIELMVVVLIATILTVIAVPSYISQVRKSHRTEAKSILMDLAAREERFMATNGVYSITASDLGLTGWGSMGSGYYTIAAPTVTAPAAGTATTAATPATFSFTATATSFGNQLNDTQCITFTLTQAGVQSSTNAVTGGSATTGCW
jgi:type IV pilus assembly protein PilE